MIRALIFLSAFATFITGCSIAPDIDAISDSDARQSVAQVEKDDLRFFDPCSEMMSEWFAIHGLRLWEIIPPETNEGGSDCTYENGKEGFALLSQPAEPDGSTERWVHTVLRAQGSPQDVDITDHQGEYVVQQIAEFRQGCHVMVPVYYGFLHITGGPYPGTEQPMPRDCDAARTLSEDLVEYIDESFWQTLGGALQL